LVITGHSLGAALAVLAAPDVAKNIAVPEPQLTTFGGPRTGLVDFAVPFNLLIDVCFRVVNLFDIVPHLPLALPGLPYTHVGVETAVNSGGPIDQTYRHGLNAYRAGLTDLITAQPAWAA
jgi:predicted lipase